MRFIKHNLFPVLLLFVLITSVTAQTKTIYEVLSDAELTRIVPTSFYFAGQSAQTQMRNATAAKIGKDRFVIVGLVDTSGYSTEIQGKYEGFFITDSPVKLGTRILGTGAYGFGFTKTAINIFDLSSKQILSVRANEDSGLKRPRPLMMTADSKGIRLYKGKTYVLIAPK